MHEALASERRARALRAPRVLNELVFAQTKAVRRIDRFQRRGLTACRAEWRLIAATHNLLKLWRHRQAAAATAEPAAARARRSPVRLPEPAAALPRASTTDPTQSTTADPAPAETPANIERQARQRSSFRPALTPAGATHTTAHLYKVRTHRGATL